MFDLLERLREKPKAYRVRVAIISALVLTVVIVGSWFLTLDLGNGKKMAEERVDGPSPFATLKGGFSQFFDEGAAQYGAFKSLFEEVATGTEER